MSFAVTEFTALAIGVLVMLGMLAVIALGAAAVVWLWESERYGLAVALGVVGFIAVSTLSLWMRIDASHHETNCVKVIYNGTAVTQCN